MKRILSGVQPTGHLHLGNYLGAIRNWVKLQEQGEALFCIVDLHAITVYQDPDELRAATRKTAAAYIACGVDPDKSAIFVQSAVPAHSELAWLLSCHTPLGWLNRMTQFKEKAGKKREQANLGLYSYPVLMAADILAYKATHIPVGEDQKQHLELARDIAGAVNRCYDQEFFPLPEPIIQGDATRVMSLRDGTSKMSKSDSSDNSRINLTDDVDTIIRKVKKAKSDSIAGITYEPEVRPEAANLVTIYASIMEKSIDAVVEEFADSGFADFKKTLAEVMADHLGPITQKMQALEADPVYLDSLLVKGNEKANTIANANMAAYQDMVGLLRV